MLPTNEDLRYTDMPILPQSLLQLSQVKLVDIDVPALHMNPQVVEEVQHISTLLECTANTSKAGHINYNFSFLCI